LNDIVDSKAIGHQLGIARVFLTLSLIALLEIFRMSRK